MNILFYTTNEVAPQYGGEVLKELLLILQMH